MSAAQHSAIDLEMRVNGRPVSLRIEPHELLIDVLRERLGLIGTKKSCDMQVCGACTVLVDGKMVSSCSYLAYEARQKNVVTIEGLADGEHLHPVQDAFIEHGGFQCGFCTSGMILSATALLDENPKPTTEEIKHFMRGNVCRCTGYESIIESIHAAAEETPGK